MINCLQLIAWFTVPFIVTLVAFTALQLGSSSSPNTSVPPPHASELVGLPLRVPLLIDAQGRTTIAEQGLSIPDTAVVVLLGGISCSANQIDVLRHWSEQQNNHSLNNYPVLAIYADPMLGLEQGVRESRLLRRVSQARFPFFVSQDTLLNPRARGIRTPQVVLAETQIIAHVFDLPAKSQPPSPLGSVGF